MRWERMMGIRALEACGRCGGSHGGSQGELRSDQEVEGELTFSFV